MSREQLPQANRTDAEAHGHWLLARLGKKVLRPGGVELTTRLLDAASIGGSDVVELASGLGHTARAILARGPSSYTAVDSDADALAIAARAVGEEHTLVNADASETGRPDASADVVIGEAMLTMQGEKAKNAIVGEAARLLRPGGRYAIHELGLLPDDLAEDVKTDIRTALARAIRVNARPQTISEWSALLEAHGLTVTHTDTAPMALLQSRRIIADEGLRGALRFASRVATQPDARKRVLSMRRTFNTYKEHLTAVAIIATKTADAE